MMLNKILSLFSRRKDIRVYELVGIPKNKPNISELFIKKLKGLEFSILYDFRDMKIFLIAVDFLSGLIESISKSITGLSFIQSEEIYFKEMRSLFRYNGIPFKHFAVIQDPFAIHKTEIVKRDLGLLEDLSSAFRESECYLLVSFYPVSLFLLNEIKKHWEGEMTKLNPVSREGVSFQNATKSMSRSETSEGVRYMDTDKAMRASELIAMCDNAILHGDGVYKVSVFGCGEKANLLKQHLVGKYGGTFRKVKVTGSLRKCMPVDDGETLSGNYASSFINFNSDFAREEIVMDIAPIPKSVLSESEGSSEVGFELLKGIEEGKRIYLNPISFNTNVAIIGQQRMGKTVLGKRIAKSAIKAGAGVIVFSPSKEWGSIAKHNKKMLVIKIAESIPFNLVKCPNGVRREQYYQNLALLLANAMGAGPYTNPLRNVMLNSFTSLYSKDEGEGLVGIYNSIYNGIVEFYAYDRHKGGESFGKFGQNIRASLENLRQIVLKEQFRVEKGIEIEDCIRDGAVFDLSDCSELERALLYAFILAQIYSYVLCKFDEKGDAKLRLLIILEEAHTIFKERKKDDVNIESTATVDLEKKLGMFGKRGVGIVFITHFADQISSVIRRHAQTHFYFKQDSEALESALEDLKFNQSDEEEWKNASAKILSLPTGVAACRAVHISGRNERVEVGPFFIKTIFDGEEELDANEIDSRIKDYFKRRGIRKKRKIKIAAKVISKENLQAISGAKVELSLCGSLFSFGETSLNESRDAFAFLDAFENEEYEIRVMKEGFKTIKKRIIARKNGVNNFELEFSNKKQKEMRSLPNSKD